jgi:hypothetical protein
MFRRTQSRRAVFVAALLVMLAARDGAAQSSGGARRVFAGASVAWNIDHSTWQYYDSEPTGNALAAGLALGINFADRWSVQVEGEWPTSDYTAHHLADYQFQTQESRVTYRTPTVAVLFGVHWRLPKRVDIAFQFGPCLQNKQQDYEYQTLVNGTVVESHRYSSNDWLLRTSLGAETAVAVTSRVSVVAQVRVHLTHGLYSDGLLSGAIVRPAVGVRVRF